MRFYSQGREQGTFEDGVRLLVQSVLAHPRFVFRAERAPAAVDPAGNYRISDIELASRLSFFLWGTRARSEADSGGDAEDAVDARGPAGRGSPHARGSARPTRWPRALPAQWLRLQDVDKIRPDGLFYPYWDRSLSQAFRKETELFFSYLVREDRSVRDLLTADYSFVNERIARHYGIPNVTGRRVPQGHAAGVAARHSRAGQRAAAHLGRRPHVAGAARQVGDAGAARVAAAAAAAERAGCSKRPRKRTARAC